MERNLHSNLSRKRAKEESMTIGIQFREVYIHLSENEPALVCTVRYRGLIVKSTHFPLQVGRADPPKLDEESLPVVRVRNRRGDSPQGGR